MRTLIDVVEMFGDVRGEDGDEFVSDRHAAPGGRYLYRTGDSHVGIVVWGSEHSCTVSVFSAARIRMRPTYELYRYVSRWRTTVPTGAPYVVESDGEATVMCEQSFSNRQFGQEDGLGLLIASSIDLVGDTASIIGRDLSGADGAPFTGVGIGGLMALVSWWDVADDRIQRIVGFA